MYMIADICFKRESKILSLIHKELIQSATDLKMDELKLENT